MIENTIDFVKESSIKFIAVADIATGATIGLGI